MIIFLNITVLITLAWLGYRYFNGGRLKVYYWPGLIFKIIMGLALGYVYANYLGNGDTWALFNAAVDVKEISFSNYPGFKEIFFKNDFSSIENFRFGWIPSAFMVKILAVFALVTDSNYWITSTYFSLLSFFGFWKLAQTIDNMGSVPRIAALSLLFFPSLVFWTSGILKESIAIGALAWIAAIFIEAYLGNRLGYKRVACFLFALVILAILKYYFAAMVLVSIVSAFIVRRVLIKDSKWYIELTAVIIIFLGIAGLASLTHPNLWFSRFLDVIYENYTSFVSISDPENLILYKNLQPTWASFFFYTPKALLAGLFFPLWAKSFVILKGFAILENWFLVILSIVAIVKFKLPISKDSRILLFVALLFIAVAAVFIAFSTPNLGTLARYKVGYMLVLIPLLCSAAFSRQRRY